MPMQPRYESATRRRQCRRNVRNVLGTSSDPAPEAGQVIRAAEAMDELIRLASNGRFALVLVDQVTAEPIGSHGALKIAREER